jgi:protein-S-isoprenylcysteine O-methyltransferase Ste14
MDYTSDFIFLCFALFIVYWLATSFTTKRTAGGTSWWQRWRLFAFVIVLSLLFIYRNVLASHEGPLFWQHTILVGIVADIITFLGLIILFWARAALGGNWSSSVVIKERHELIERGPYAIVRHPIYSGMLVMILGVAINYGHAAWFAVFIFCLFGFYIKASQEEILLARHFPIEYPEYRRRVRALIPFVF